MRDNPGESLSLKENRCRFTYVEAPQSVMRLSGSELFSWQLEGAYLINALSLSAACGAWPSESHRTKANEGNLRLAHMGTGLHTDCVCFHWLWDKALRLNIHREEYLTGHFSVLQNDKQ